MSAKLQTDTKYDVFISYNHESSAAFVKMLYEKLRIDFNLKVWLDNDALEGNNLFEQLKQGIIDSKVFLSCITKKYGESSNCIREISYASVNGKPLIIIMLEKLDIFKDLGGGIDFIISSLTRFNLYKDGLTDYSKLFEHEEYKKMLRTLNSHLSNEKLNAYMKNSSKKFSKVKSLENYEYKEYIEEDDDDDDVDSFSISNLHLNEEFYNYLDEKLQSNDENSEDESEILANSKINKQLLDNENEDKWVGKWKDGKMHGKGILYFSDGGKLEGEFLEGAPVGNVKMYFKDGGFYEGGWLDDEPTGQGTLISVDGNRYEGEFLKGKMHGLGSFYYSDGDVYKGEWMDGNRNGKGIYYSSDGNKYKGYWLNDKKHGRGVAYYNNGTKEAQEWLDGDILE